MVPRGLQHDVEILVRNRDPGISSTKVLSSSNKMAVASTLSSCTANLEFSKKSPDPKRIEPNRFLPAASMLNSNHNDNNSDNNNNDNYNHYIYNYIIVYIYIYVYTVAINKKHSPGEADRWECQYCIVVYSL